MRVRMWQAAPIALCLIALLASCGGHAATRVLFVGNSFTFYNGGIDAQLAEMAPSCRTQLLATGGYTLQQHWNDGSELATIRSGHFSYVVLQEQSQTPVYDRALFATYAADFSRLIKAQRRQPGPAHDLAAAGQPEWGETTASLAAATRPSARRSAPGSRRPACHPDVHRARPDLVLTRHQR